MIILNSIPKKSLKGVKVILRVDYNVPIEKGKIKDDTRIRLSLPTIKLLLKKEAAIIIISHLGRPEGREKKDLSLLPIKNYLEKKLKQKILFRNLKETKKTKSAIKGMKPKTIMLLENIRFFKEEEACDMSFAKKLASLGDIFINDAFATTHRNHASNYGIGNFLKTYSGLLMEKEIKNLEAFKNGGEKPITLIIGGAKIETKIGTIKHFYKIADNFIFGGGIANTLLASQGYEMGKSLVDKNAIKEAKMIIKNLKSLNKKIILPTDFIVEKEISEKNISKINKIRNHDKIQIDEMALDIGPKTLKQIEKTIISSKTIIWNGPFGLIEKKPYGNGTTKIASALVKATKKGAKTLIGGGDSEKALKQAKINSKEYTCVSTGGGAMLEFMEGKIKVKKSK